MSYGRLEFAILGTIYVLLGTWLEEKTAQLEMGDVYKKYQKQVPMWIPGLKP
jgi:protein-S-isoprenylcysteine O-methyltransferase Ste14